MNPIFLPLEEKITMVEQTNNVPSGYGFEVVEFLEINHSIHIFIHNIKYARVGLSVRVAMNFIFLKISLSKFLANRLKRLRWVDSLSHPSFQSKINWGSFSSMFLRALFCSEPILVHMQWWPLSILSCPFLPLLSFFSLKLSILSNQQNYQKTKNV